MIAVRQALQSLDGGRALAGILRAKIRQQRPDTGLIADSHERGHDSFANAWKSASAPSAAASAGTASAWPPSARAALHRVSGSGPLKAAICDGNAFSGPLVFRWPMLGVRA